jgi:stage V sporulation protein B
MIALTVTALIMRTTGVFFQVYISNKIGPAGIGLFQLIISVYILALTVSISGIKLAATRLVAEELAIGNSVRAKRAVINCLTYSLAFSLGIGFVLFTTAEYVAIQWLSDARAILSLRILAFSLPFISLSSVFSGYFLAVRRVMKAASVQLLEQGIKIAATMFFLSLIVHNDLELAAAVIVAGACIGEFVSFFLNLYIYIADAKTVVGGSGYSSDLLSRMFKISLPVAFSAYFTSGLRTLQQILVPMGLRKSGSSGDSALATYGIINGMVMPILMYPAAVLHVAAELVVPELAESKARGSANRVNYIVNRVLSLGVMCSIFVTLIFLRFSTDLGLALYTSREAGHFIWVLAPILPIMYMDMLTDGMLKGLNEQVSTMRYNIIESVISVILIYLLLPYYAINAYIFILYLGRAINFILSLGKLATITPLIQSSVTAIKALFSMLTSLFLANIVIIVINNLSGLKPPNFFLVPIVACIYYLLLRVTACITREDLVWFKSVLSR